MRVLHIVNCYFGSKVHSELFRRLDEAGIEQVVYNVMKKCHGSMAGRNVFDGRRTDFIFEPILGFLHRFMFFAKTRATVNNLLQHVNIYSIDVIHASTSHSDGFVALELHHRFGIPYIVSVRNADLNTHARVPFLWFRHRKVLDNANKIVCITPLLKERLLSNFTLFGIRDRLAKKTVVIPNGVSDYWLNNLRLNRLDKKLNSVLYIGRFDDDKNVVKLLDAAIQVRKQIPNLKMDLVGGGGPYHDEVMRIVNDNREWLSFLGEIYDKDKLKVVYRQHDVFAMVSVRETFGLVYLEAMSQGLKILFSKGQGIDGMFCKHIGEAVNAKSVEDIAKGLKLLLENDYEMLTSEELCDFKWDTKTLTYIEMYKAIVD